MFDFFVPNVNFFGRGSVEIVGERCEILGGKKALIVTDAFLKKLAGGPVEKVVASLEAIGIEVAYFDEVEPNPKDHNIYVGLKVYNETNCDLIVTVGGGSAQDCGTGIGIAATREGS